VTDAAIWLAAGLALLVAEIMMPGVFMMWLGIAALGTGALVHWQDLVFAWQVLAFAMLAAIALGIGVRVRPARPATVLNTQESGLLNRGARVIGAGTHEIRVRVGDTDWTARLAHGVAAPTIGTELKVVGVDGTTLIVG
jgi:membrane protein implicated in regulation of membrane protease activity